MATAPSELTAILLHVAGPPEKQPDRSPAGWRYVQRCLRCDREIETRDAWFKLGSAVYEIGDGGFTSEPKPGQHAGSAPRCRPGPL